MIIVFFGFIPVYRVLFRLQFHFYEVSSSFVLNGTSFFDKVILGKRSFVKGYWFSFVVQKKCLCFQEIFYKRCFYETTT